MELLWIFLGLLVCLGYSADADVVGLLALLLRFLRVGDVLPHSLLGVDVLLDLGLLFL